MLKRICLLLGALAPLASCLKNNGMLYVFAYSWQPGFCYGKTTYVGCSNPQSFWEENFTIHGLWPQYEAGGYPASCTTEPFNTSVPLAVGWSTMTTYWPNVQYAETDPNYDSFWDHEWSKHGTCSGLSQMDYIQLTINHAKALGTPSVLQKAIGSTISAASLRDAFGGAQYVSLQCTNGTMLNGAYLCTVNTNGVPGGSELCPADVMGEDSCTSATISVPSF